METLRENRPDSRLKIGKNAKAQTEGKSRSKICDECQGIS